MRFGDRLSSAVLCGLMVALVFVGPLSDASAQHSEGWPDIVFAKSLGSVFQLYGVMADGGELDRLYPWPQGVSSTHPVWSPDRSRVAFASRSFRPSSRKSAASVIIPASARIATSRPIYSEVVPPRIR